MKQSNSTSNRDTLSVKDAILIGAYAAVYFIVMGVGTLLSVLIFRNPNMATAPHFTALLAGPVYYILVRKVPKFGAITVVGIVIALFFTLSGHFMISFIPSLLFGVLADVIARFGHYKHRIAIALSYVVFVFGNLGPIYLMWFVADAYRTQLALKGKSAEYIDRVMVPLSMETVVLYCGGLVVCGLLGALLGQWMERRHLQRIGHL